MGWFHGPAEWAEVERILSGRSAPKREENTEPKTRVKRSGTFLPPVRNMPGEGEPASTYAELHAHSAYSFLDGASTPEDMVAAAVELGLSHIALTDHNGFYGVVRFAEAAAEHGIATVFGSELTLPGDEHLLVLARGNEGYKRLSAAIADAHMRGGEKGVLSFDIDALSHASEGQWQILTGCRKGAVRRALADGGPEAARAQLRRLATIFGHDNIAVELTWHGEPEDTERCDALAKLAAEEGMPIVATTGAHCASPADARLSSAMAALAARDSLDDHAAKLAPAGGHFLRSAQEMEQLFRRWPDAVVNTRKIAQEAAFDLRLVAPNLPPFDVPEGHDEASWLCELARRGGKRRFLGKKHEREGFAQIEKELEVICQLGFPGYFLVVHDIVEFCRAEAILCQGRGSAANSAVCFALGITAIDPVGAGLLFERFLSPERDGPPDIDIDIESGRREEVIQHVYTKYGRRHAAQVANVITYRGRSAVRDAAKALGYSPGQQDAWSKGVDRWSGLGAESREDTEGTVPAGVLQLARRFVGLPRHLGIHSGGMVMCDRPVAEVVPTEWARMENRSVLQWDKDDCAAVGLVKFDLLGLGMLTAIHEAMDLALAHKDLDVDLADLDLADPEIYEMLCRADTVGVFQVESRAQMSTLPRLRPRTFYDLVVEVALIRPGPIQGGSVHPYIRRRNGLEKVTYDHPALEKSLGRTLGIPLFQEQLMQIATDLAGFSGAEADQLRRAMGSKRSPEKMERLRRRFFDGMRELHGIGNGVPGTPESIEVGQKVWEKIVAFAAYGFPESHSQSFASIVYYSAWFKRYHPAIFCAALLRAQPMGFYSPQSLVADARRHGVTVHRPCVNRSMALADCEAGGTEVRLGLASVRGLGKDAAERIADARDRHGPFRDAADLSARADLSVTHMESLATAGALDALVAVADKASSRRAALWSAATAARHKEGMLPGLSQVEAPSLPGMSLVELATADLAVTGITPDCYPTEFARAFLDDAGVLQVSGLDAVPDGTRIRVAGAITHRQRPASAEGVTFLSLEDETGMANVVCSRGLWARYRPIVSSAPAVVVRGIVENASGAVNVVADKIERLHLGMAIGRSRDFQ